MKKEWTPWRNSNFIFFRDTLQHYSHALHLYDLGSDAEQFKEVFHNFVYKPVDFEKFSDNTLIADLTQAFPFEDGVADIVTLSNTLEHIPTPDHFIHECSRILKQGGLIIGTVPFLLGLHQIPYDFNRYTPFQLKRFLEQSGFTDITVVSLGNQVDVYNTIELKVFDELRKQKGGFILEMVRFIRRLEMRLIRRLFATKAEKRLLKGTVLLE